MEFRSINADFGGLLSGKKIGLDARFRNCGHLALTGFGQFQGVFALSLWPHLRELNTHTPQMNDKIQRIKEIFCVKTPVFLSKNIWSYPPIIAHEELIEPRDKGEVGTHFWGHLCD